MVFSKLKDSPTSYFLWTNTHELGAFYVTTNLVTNPNKVLKLKGLYTYGLRKFKQVMNSFMFENQMKCFEGVDRK